MVLSWFMNLRLVDTCIRFPCHLIFFQAIFTHSRVFTETNIPPPPFSIMTSCTQHCFQKSCHLHQPP